MQENACFKYALMQFVFSHFYREHRKESNTILSHFNEGHARLPQNMYLYTGEDAHLPGFISRSLVSLYVISVRSRKNIISIIIF